MVLKSAQNSIITVLRIDVSALDIRSTHTYTYSRPVDPVNNELIFVYDKILYFSRGGRRFLQPSAADL